MGVRIIRYTPPPGKPPERQESLRPPAAGARVSEPRKRLLAATVSAGAHLGVIAALVWAHFALRPPPPKPEPALTLVSIKPLPEPPGPPAGTQSASNDMADIAPPPPPQVNAPLVSIVRVTAPDSSDLLSESQVAGAARAGEGGAAGGGGCDTARAVQQVLRRDPRVRVAMAEAQRLGKASMLWNGDWIRSGGQEGKGLAVVRQAIIWEVAFEPEACRNARMHGMVLLALADGNTRFAIGTGDWRWSDLLGLGKARR